MKFPGINIEIIKLSPLDNTDDYKSKAVNFFGYMAIITIVSSDLLLLSVNSQVDDQTILIHQIVIVFLVAAIYLSRQKHCHYRLSAAIGVISTSFLITHAILNWFGLFSPMTLLIGVIVIYSNIVLSRFYSYLIVIYWISFILCLPIFSINRNLVTVPTSISYIISFALTTGWIFWLIIICKLVIDVNESQIRKVKESERKRSIDQIIGDSVCRLRAQLSSAIAAMDKNSQDGIIDGPMIDELSKAHGEIDSIINELKEVSKQKNESITPV